MQVAVLEKRLARVDPVVGWLGRLAAPTRRHYGYSLKHFLGWLNRQPGWLGVDAKGLLLRQVGAEDPYEVLELLQEFVQGLDRTKHGKWVVYTAVRSFFLHNRCALPSDRSFTIRSEKPPVASQLTLQHVGDLVKAARVRDRSLLLVKWQSMQDNSRLIQLGRSCAGQIVQQIEMKVHPVRVDLPGRKRNQKPFYTFIGKDATDALVQYFEKERGWPRPGEAIWLQKPSNVTRPTRPLTVPALSELWIGLCRRIGLIPKRQGPRGTKYGYGPHEMRDIAKSLLHTQAKKDGFDMDCAKFWMGHTVDPLGYDKFHQDQVYTRKQYLIAEKYLNIISQPPATEEAKRQEEKIAVLENELARLKPLEAKIANIENLLTEVKNARIGLENKK